MANSCNFLKNCDFRAVQRSALCRSRRELSNAYFLAKFGFDTAENEIVRSTAAAAENEPSKVCPLSAYIIIIIIIIIIDPPGAQGF